AYLARFRHVRSGEDITYLRFAICGTVGDIIAGRTLDAPIVRTLWMTPEELRACPERHRSPLLLRCIEDHLAGQRAPLALLHADPSLYM
ncbi:MAG TPA: NUDIX hydrolase, partial [Ideonella sp.]|nr:NUDIX hydrolase [Ideonella sp.]